MRSMNVFVIVAILQSCAEIMRLLSYISSNVVVYPRVLCEIVL